MPGPAKDTSATSGVSPEQLRRQRFDAHMAEVAPAVAWQWRVIFEDGRVGHWNDGKAPGTPHNEEERSLCVLTQTLRDELYSAFVVADLLAERGVPTGSPTREYTLAERVLMFAGQEQAARAAAVYTARESDAAFVERMSAEMYLTNGTIAYEDDCNHCRPQFDRLIALARLGASASDDGGSSLAPQLSRTAPAEDVERLCANIEALLSLDANNALVPHGIGGHARALLTQARAALAAMPDRRDHWCACDIPIQASDNTSLCDRCRRHLIARVPMPDRRREGMLRNLRIIASTALIWLDGALKCEEWHWSPDQREFAKESADQLRAAIRAAADAAPGETEEKRS